MWRGRRQPRTIIRTTDEPINGNLWFADLNGHIGRITLDGAAELFNSGLTPGAQPGYITSGPDGNVWFGELGISSIGRITVGTSDPIFAGGFDP